VNELDSAAQIEELAGQMLCPMFVPAPGRLSTMTCWLRYSVSFAASSLALMSTPPPGVNGTTRRIGLVG
jgi:hypothetical protein